MGQLPVPHAVSRVGQLGYQVDRSRGPLEAVVAHAVPAKASSSKPQENAEIKSKLADLLGRTEGVAREAVQATAKKSKHE